MKIIFFNKRTFSENFNLVNALYAEHLTKQFICNISFNYPHKPFYEAGALLLLLLSLLSRVRLCATP